MSRIIDTTEGSFRQVTDNGHPYFILECSVCGEMLQLNDSMLAGEEPITHESKIYPASFCSYQGTKKLGPVLVSTMQSLRLMGYKPYHDEGEQFYQPISGGVDARRSRRLAMSDVSTRWVLASDDDGHDYCIPAEYLGLFSKWVESIAWPASVVDYSGPDFQKYRLKDSPLFLTFVAPEYRGNEWKP